MNKNQWLAKLHELAFEDTRLDKIPFVCFEPLAEGIANIQARKEIMKEIDFTLMSNIAEEVEREHEGLLPFTEMVNILLAKYYAAQQSRALDGDEPRCEGCGGVLIMFSRYCHVCGRPRQ